MAKMQSHHSKMEWAAPRNLQIGAHKGCTVCYNHGMGTE